MVEYQDSIAPYNSVQTMGNSNHCAVFKLLLDQLLDLLLCHDVDVCGGFVEDDYLVLAQDGATDADKLALSCAQIRTPFIDLKVDTLALLFSFLAVAS